jgi:Ran GTPase-activating protein (RanGAP) involved in mRNA processing and transport
LKIIEERFSEYLKDIIWPTQNQKEKEFWNVSGILKEKSNQHFKFDVRPMFNMGNGQLGKKGTTLSKTDKIVFETDREWVIIDFNEFNDFIKKQSSKIIQFEDLLKKLEWNIYISKV